MSRSDTLTDNSRMTFGKWQGERLTDIPDEYWEWFLAKGLQYAHPAIGRWLKTRQNESNSPERNPNVV